VREEVAAEDWQQMSELICQTPATNHGFIGFFFDDYEILPQNLHGRFYFNTAEQAIENLEPSCKARAVLESQCLAKRLYLQRANIDLVHDVNQIVITGKNEHVSTRHTNGIPFHLWSEGGASVNVDLLQILADVFAKPVYAAWAPNSGCLGGALRAMDATQLNGTTSTSTSPCLVAAHPRSEYTPVYDEMLVRYAKLEDRIMQNIEE
jgi:sugar (pentulose or hexulose) kinase